MRKAVQLLVVFLLSALAAVGLASLIGIRIGGDERPRSLGAPVPGAGTEAGSPTARQLAELATAGHLREAQDEYLRILRDNPGDAGAMRRLVVVRRRLASDDSVVLRRQAAAYRQMIVSGVEPPEHYSRKAMELLATASLQAAAAVESEQRSIAQRASGAVGPATPRGAAPPDKAAFTPPASSAAPTPGNKVNPQISVPGQPAPSKPQSRVAPGQAGAPPTPPQATAQPATTPEPQTPPAPPAASTAPPQQPPAGQTAPAPGSPEGTVAVVPPTTTGQGVAPSEGSLASVDCQKKTFVIHGSNGDEEYLTAPNFTIYIRGISSERLSDFCGLQRHLGRGAMVWSISDGDRKIAKSMSIVLPAQ